MTAKLFFLIGLLTLVSCRRNQESSSPCVEASECAAVDCMPAHNVLKFVLLDAETGEDLLFAEDPLLQPEDVVVRNNCGEELILNLNRSATGRSSVSIETGNTQVKDTLYLEIQRQPVHTLYPRFCHISCCTPMAYEMRSEKGSVKRREEYIFELRY